MNHGTGRCVASLGVGPSIGRPDRLLVGGQLVHEAGAS